MPLRLGDWSEIIRSQNRKILLKFSLNQKEYGRKLSQNDRKDKV